MAKNIFEQALRSVFRGYARQAIRGTVNSVVESIQRTEQPADYITIDEIRNFNNDQVNLFLLLIPVDSTTSDSELIKLSQGLSKKQINAIRMLK